MQFALQPCTYAGYSHLSLEGLSPGCAVIGGLTSKWDEVSRLADLGLSERFQAGQQNQSE